MAVLIPAGFGQVGMELRNSGDPDSWYMTFGVAIDRPEVEDSVIGAKINQAFEESWLLSMTANTTLVGCQFTRGVAPFENITSFTASGETGDGSTGRLPQNCALLVAKRTALGGRRNRGRFFVPNVLTDGAVDNVGVIGQPTVDAFQAVADQFLGDLADEDYEGYAISLPMVILHNEASSGTTPSPTTVNKLTVDGRISTQRRRLR
uniref:Uncharacterized protein n=1 Tax=uncultured prokaryote TaxID=198431 RepID=A0A0H5Q8M2_9ZZZZ|nr:hypothetical protein [uncultured prokaryote]